MNNFITSGPVIVALKMRKFLITANLKAIMIALCFLSYGVFVPTPLKADETDEAALDLLKLFDEATEIVTKSKLNADYVPGMVTVLHGKDLQARGGVRNLFDEDIYYAAPANTYPDDYPRPGINFWTQLSYEF